MRSPTRMIQLNGDRSLIFFPGKTSPTSPTKCLENMNKKSLIYQINLILTKLSFHFAELALNNKYLLLACRLQFAADFRKWLMTQIFSINLLEPAPPDPSAEL